MTMTSLQRVFGMLELAYLLLLYSAYCLGLFSGWGRRWRRTRARARRGVRTLVLAAALPGVALAQAPAPAGADPHGGPGGGEHRHLPSAESIAACAGQASGAACAFTDHRGNARTGTCDVPPVHGSAGEAAPGATTTPTAPTGALACHPAGRHPDHPPASGSPGQPPAGT